MSERNYADIGPKGAVSSVDLCRLWRVVQDQGNNQARYAQSYSAQMIGEVVEKLMIFCPGPTMVYSETDCCAGEIPGAFIVLWSALSLGQLQSSLNTVSFTTDLALIS